MRKLFPFMLLSAALITFSSCGDDEKKDLNVPKLTKTSYTMHQADVQAIKGTNIEDLAWESDNEFVATVENSSITGMYVGKTNVKSLTNNLTFTVEVEPKYNIYEEPLIDWNATKVTIKAKYGAPDYETDESLLYQTSNSNAPMMLFLFQDGKIFSYSVVCVPYVASQVVDFLSERYLLLKDDTVNKSLYFAHCYGKIKNPKADYGVVMQYNADVQRYMVMYLNVQSDESRSVYEADYASAFKAASKVAAKALK